MTSCRIQIHVTKGKKITEIFVWIKKRVSDYIWCIANERASERTSEWVNDTESEKIHFFDIKGIRQCDNDTQDVSSIFLSLYFPWHLIRCACDLSETIDSPENNRNKNAFNFVREANKTTTTLTMLSSDYTNMSQSMNKSIGFMTSFICFSLPPFWMSKIRIFHRILVEYSRICRSHLSAIFLMRNHDWFIILPGERRCGSIWWARQKKFNWYTVI